MVFQRNIDDIDEQSEKPGYSLYRASGSRAAAASDLFNTTRGKLEDSSATTYHINWSGDTGVDRGTEAHKEYLANLKKDFVSQMKVAMLVDLKTNIRSCRNTSVRELRLSQPCQETP